MEKLNNFTNILNSKPFIKSLISNLNADVYLVGGATRDLILNKPNKDIDLLIRKVPIDLLISDLQKFGKVDVVGKSFGVIKFIDQDGVDYDIALPRMEKPTGEGGYKGFEIQSDENLPIDVDLSRRDARFNAMGIHLNTGTFIDPLGGLKDIENKQISAANPEAFSDDPLRMIRIVAQACRFNFTIENNTMQMILDNASRIKEISAERLLTEFDKIIKKGDIRIGVQLLKDTKLFENIFGFELKQSVIDRSPFEEVRTMGEFIYLMIRLLSNPSEYYLKRFSAEDAKRDKIYKDIKALDLAFNYDGENPIEARSIAHNMYVTSSLSIESLILPEVIGVACQELLSGKYLKIVNELALNGQDLMNLGLKGKEIGDAQKKLLINIYADKVANTPEDLTAFLNKGNMEEGVGDKYAEKKFNIPNEEDKFERVYQSELQKNMENHFGVILAKISYDDKLPSKIPVYKNPKSLTNFDRSVRGIIDSNGNIYVSFIDGNFNHGYMAKEIGLTKNDVQIYDNPKSYILVLRIGTTNSFGLSDSSDDASINYGREILEILQKCKKLNPQFNFFDTYYLNVRSNNQPISVDNNIQENLDETIKGGEYTMYHGTDHDITNFTDEFVGGENANDQEGPGIYFTSSIENAGRFGKNIYKVILKPRKLADVARKNIVPTFIVTALIKASPSIKVDNEDSLSNWGMNPAIALRKAVASVIEYSENEKDLFQQIWIDFYRNYPVEFVRNMVKIGYDGELLERVDNITHIIIYNPNSITSIEKLENNQELNSTEKMDESFQSDLKAFKAEKELQKQLKPTDLPKDKTGKYIMKDIAYTAIVLNERSKAKIIEAFKDRIPKGYRIVADHMTICLGRLPENQQDEIGLTKQLTVESFGIDDKVAAVGVTGFPSNNEHPHVTLAVNDANGGKPMMSNYLTNWEKALRIRISGVVTEVPYTI